MREFVVAALASLPYQPLAASDATAALEVIEQEPDTVLLLTDVDLPGTNGIDLRRTARFLR